MKELVEQHLLSLLYIADPTISSVSPTFGPMAGGSTLTVSGTILNIGNTENTRVTLNGSDALECAIQ